MKSSSEQQQLFDDGKISVITFSTQDATFAIPLHQVRFIEQDVERYTRLDADNEHRHEVITYQNRAIPLFDFCTMTGSKSAAQAGAERLRAVRAFSESLHKLKQQIEANLWKDEQASGVDRLFADWNSGDIDRWQKSLSHQSADINELARSYAAELRKIYRELNFVIELCTNNKTKAREKYQEMEKTAFVNEARLLENLCDSISTSIRPIIVFVDHGKNRLSAIRLENINDIQSYDWQQFSDEESKVGAILKEQTDIKVEGYLRNGDDAPFVLLNCQAEAG